MERVCAFCAPRRFQLERSAGEVGSGEFNRVERERDRERERERAISTGSIMLGTCQMHPGTMVLPKLGG